MGKRAIVAKRNSVLKMKTNSLNTSTNIFLDFNREYDELNNNNDRKFVFALFDKSKQKLINKLETLNWDRWINTIKSFN